MTSYLRMFTNFRHLFPVTSGRILFMKKLTSDLIELQSMNITEDNISKLNSLFPEAFNENGIDFDILKQLLGENVDEKEERYGLNWHGKRQARQLALTPSRGTLRPCKDESVDWHNTKNLMIEGDNLEVLKLLQKSYAGKVKLIYIDPPYNTGKDFVYSDNFQDNMKNYLEMTGQTEDGTRLSTNSETSGRYHTDWLNMMYPRLKLARNLLSDDGVIFMSIDDNEVCNLKLLCDEIFGESNFISSSFVISNPRGRQSDTFVATVHDSLIIYSKNSLACKVNGMPLTPEQKSEFNFIDDSGESYRLLGLRQRGAASRREDRPDMFFPIYVCPDDGSISLTKKDNWFEVLPKKSDGTEGRWMWGKDKCNKDINLLVSKLIVKRDEYDIFIKDFLNKSGEERTRKYKSIWDKKSYNNQNGTQEVKSLLGADVMSFPKSKEFIFDICTMGASNNDIIMDFFAGSATLGHALMDKNARENSSNSFILVQLPEPLDMKNKEQKKAAEYCDQLSKPRNIAELTKQRLRLAGKKVQEDNPEWKGDVGFRVFKLDTSNIRPWEASAETLSQQLDAYVSPILEGRSEEDLLTELMLKRGIDLSVNVETRQFDELTVSCVDGGKLFTCFAKQIPASSVEELTKGIIDWHKSLKAGKDTVCYFLDDAFENNIAKTNLCAILEQHGLTNLHSL